MPETDLDEFVDGMGDELSDDQRRALRAITKDDPDAVAVPDEVTTALTAAQKDRLNHLEGVITRNFMAFVEVGMALKEIRDSKLYIESHQTFESYARAKFELARDAAYRKISAAEVVKSLEPTKKDSIVDGQFVGFSDIDTLPPVSIMPIEAHARKLGELPPEDRPEAWNRAVNVGLSERGRVTAKAVALAVAQLKYEKTGKKLEETAAKRPALHAIAPEGTSCKRYLDALQNLYQEIEFARQRAFADVPRWEVIKDLKALLNFLEAEKELQKVI